MVELDTTPPTLMPVKLASNNKLSSSRAKSGDNLTLSFTSSEPIPAPTVALTGASVTASNTNGNGMDWVVVLPVDGSTPNESPTFSIRFPDQAGNTATTVTTTTDQSSVNVDTKTPTLTLVNLKSNNNENTS